VPANGDARTSDRGAGRLVDHHTAKNAGTRRGQRTRIALRGRRRRLQENEPEDEEHRTPGKGFARLLPKSASGSLLLKADERQVLRTLFG
jgi:hypothetical protein